MGTAVFFGKESEGYFMAKKTQFAVVIYLSFVHLGAAFGMGNGTVPLSTQVSAIGTPQTSVVYTPEQIAAMRAKNIMDLTQSEVEVLERANRWFGTRTAMRNRYAQVRTEILSRNADSLVAAMKRFFNKNLSNMEAKIGAESIAKIEGVAPEGIMARVKELLNKRESLLKDSTLQGRLTSWMRQLELKAQILKDASILEMLKNVEADMKADIARGGHPDDVDLTRSKKMQEMAERVKENTSRYNVREGQLGELAELEAKSGRLALEELLPRRNGGSAGGGYRNQRTVVPNVGAAAAAQ